MWGRSEAEEIYNAWATKPNKAAVAPEAIRTGPFKAFLEGNGFKTIIDRLTALNLKNGTTPVGQQKTAEQIWKVIDKMHRRDGLIPARELMKALEKNGALLRVMEDLTVGYAGFAKTSTAQQGKIDHALETYLALKKIHFPATKRDVVLKKMLGKGGMGGAVYLGEDQGGAKYAIKHFPVDLKDQKFNDTPQGYRFKVAHLLSHMYEARVTPTCVDFVDLGPDQYLMLELGEGEPDYTSLAWTDVVNLFKDLESIYDYQLNHIQTELTQRVAVLHLDMHGGNFMRFGGKLRLIDFGMAMLFNPDTVKKMGTVKLPSWDKLKKNPNLYLINEAAIEDQGRYIDPQGRTPSKFIEDWRRYQTIPTVLCCKGCNRQYPQGLPLTECWACGSKNLRPEKLRRADIETLARLKGVKPDDIISGPYVDKVVPDFNPEAYGCMVLTLVLIKEIWTAVERKLDAELGLGEKAKKYEARWIINSEVYGLARRNLTKFKTANREAAFLVELLLMWYDHFMEQLYEGNCLTAKDAVRYFDRGKTATKRGRSQSVSLF